MLECVVNVSEGRRPEVIASIVRAGGTAVLDVHSDAHHNRSVLTLAGPQVETAARGVATEAARLIDLREHSGAHPRLGAVDVVPFVPLGETPFGEAVAARDRFAGWIAEALGVPCFVYGPERQLPTVRRLAFRALLPDTGPHVPHPTAGAVCAGARPVLVAYNVWLAESATLAAAEAVAAELRATRGDSGQRLVRALALDVGGMVQVSMNLLEPLSFGPDRAYDEVASRAVVARGELVGLAPAAVVDAVPEERREQVGVDPSQTIEARIAAAATEWGPVAG